ncbi:class II aaRS and biotin synthetase [Paraphaeosphaeria sporulosa]|uniref:threonine--tRNA ligase n=1 Tax=Paraphaeosphaeria sporulosa TaxID=1460663 RepID=A0A177C317_9PLEO|nr:class II aaRS and biotin synthetase [Paraphaeosphaeria sporulosa]OAG01178.1 class II aaRS and biotin synthetase [Paraphaeosphaeria sporulosa]
MSPGSPLLLPNGAYVFQKLQDFLRAQYPQFGYKEVITPTIYKKSLWEKSGHWDNYAEDMFSVQGRGATGQTENAQAGEDEEFGLKPMNCPGHCLLFWGEGELKSYRDLPVRYADFSALHRNEISGSLTGLTRVRRFHQDDAHIFCRPDQILSEIEQTLKFVGMVYDTFNLGPYKLLLSTRPEEHYIGTLEEWNRAEEQLTTALNNSGREWAINEGDGAFYGPKIDIILKDATGKEHQTATIQLDFQLPQRFDLQYQASPEELEAGAVSAGDKNIDPSCRRPVIVHRAIYGSLERFMALLIEHYNGSFPFWLSPRPAVVVTLNQKPELLEYAARVQSVLAGVLDPSHSNNAQTSADFKPTPRQLSAIHLPIDVDSSARQLGKKLREAHNKKYNHIIVIGAEEAKSQTVRLNIKNQPNDGAVREVITEVLGRPLTEEDELKGTISVGMTIEEARRYFLALVERFL